MGFAVFHATKGKGSGSSIGAHIDRREGQEHTYKNANLEKRHLNQNLLKNDLSQMKLNEAISKRIEKGYTGKKALRKDAVKYVPMVFSGSHEDMKRIFSKNETASEWVKENYDFVCKEFGKENILRFTLHRDEKTPHIHAVIVPLTKDGRLSCKEVLGDRIALSERQTRYAEQMKPFGLERGIVGSKAVHNSEGWYQGQQKKEQELFLSDITKFSFVERINPLKKIEKLTDGLKLAVRQKTDATIQAKRAEERTKLVQEKLKSEADKSYAYLCKANERADKLEIAYKYIAGGKLTEDQVKQITPGVVAFKNKIEQDLDKGKSRGLSR